MLMSFYMLILIYLFCLYNNMYNELMIVLILDAVVLIDILFDPAFWTILCCVGLGLGVDL